MWEGGGGVQRKSRVVDSASGEVRLVVEKVVSPVDCD